LDRRIGGSADRRIGGAKSGCVRHRLLAWCITVCSQLAADTLAAVSGQRRQPEDHPPGRVALTHGAWRAFKRRQLAEERALAGSPLAQIA
jgi:hypothetical protein